MKLAVAERRLVSFAPADVYNGAEDDHGEADAQRYKVVTRR